MEQARSYMTEAVPLGSFGHSEGNTSGVSWSAVFAGAFVTAAFGLILISLGAGLGLSSVSLGSRAGAAADAIGTGGIIWLIVLEIVSSSLGGYLAGRLRTKWTTVHSDEVYFRDTAHGFLAWSVALVVTSAFLASAAASMAGTPHTETTKSEGQTSSSSSYFIDSMLRGDTTKALPGSAATRSEVEGIVAHDLRLGDLPAGDKSYLGQLVASRAGISQSDAETRVTNIYANAQNAAETARKALAHSLLWTFVALLIGAFSASLAATFGGRQRDHVVTTG